MGVAKYSPTVSASYAADRDWWRKFGVEGQQFDPDGFDSYGYDALSEDRAGNSEHDYESGADYSGDGEPSYPLYERVASEWSDRLIATPRWRNYQAIIDGKVVMLADMNHDQLFEEIRSTTRYLDELRTLFISAMNVANPSIRYMYDLTDMTEDRLREVLAELQDKMTVFDEGLTKAKHLADDWCRGTKK